MIINFFKVITWILLFHSIYSKNLHVRYIKQKLGGQTFPRCNARMADGGQNIGNSLSSFSVMTFYPPKITYVHM